MSKFGSLAPSDKPFRVEIVDADKGETIKDKDGNPAYIDIYSADGAIGRKFDKDERSTLIENARKGKITIDTPTDPRDSNVAKCAALTASWYLVDPETQQEIDVPCTLDNAKELYSLPLTTWLFVQPWSAANSHGNFTKRSASNSTTTQSGDLETAAA